MEIYKKYAIIINLSIKIYSLKVRFLFLSIYMKHIKIPYRVSISIANKKKYLEDQSIYISILTFFPKIIP